MLIPTMKLRWVQMAPEDMSEGGVYHLKPALNMPPGTFAMKRVKLEQWWEEMSPSVAAELVTGLVTGESSWVSKGEWRDVEVTAGSDYGNV